MEASRLKRRASPVTGATKSLQIPEEILREEIAFWSWSDTPDTARIPG
jgi:hypothetical protein